MIADSALVSSTNLCKPRWVTGWLARRQVQVDAADWINPGTDALIEVGRRWPGL
jgi:hypothetical protein